MTTDFDKLIDRRGTNSYKWDSLADEDIIPMWVADMDFETAPCIVEALKERINHGVFGYSHVPNSYYEAVCDWFKRMHHWQIASSDIIYTTGVVPAISAVIKALTLPGDQVIVQGPVYNCFYSSIRNNGCETVSNPLTYDKTTQSYRMDLDDLDRKLAHERARLMLLCNPHNPGGRVWTRKELIAVASLCVKHGVQLVSDEIHGELTLHNNHYTPIGTLPEELSENTITCCSPTKAFNIAGLQIANIICKEPKVRERINRAININEVCDVNPFGIEALQAAYSEQGKMWLEDLRNYLTANYDELLTRFATELPEFPVTKMEGTYLAWEDCSAAGITSQEIEDFLLKKFKVWINAGSIYGQEGESFVRINMACPRQRLTKGLNCIIDGLKELYAKRNNTVY